MKNTKETIDIIVKVEINYQNKKERAEAIRQAKEGVTSVSLLGSVGFIPRGVKLAVK